MVQLQTIEDPSAIRRQTPSEESDLGPGNPETEAPESTKNSWSERISRRNRREKLHNSGLGSGSVPRFNSEKPAGWKGSSACRTASFPTPNRVSYSSELYLHASYGTNTVLEKMENEKMELE